MHVAAVVSNRPDNLDEILEARERMNNSELNWLFYFVRFLPCISRNRKITELPTFNKKEDREVPPTNSW